MTRQFTTAAIAISLAISALASADEPRPKPKRETNEIVAKHLAKIYKHLNEDDDEKEPGWYYAIRFCSDDIGEWTWCGPFATFDAAEDWRIPSCAFDPDICGCSTTSHYYGDRPESKWYCNPNSFAKSGKCCGSGKDDESGKSHPIETPAMFIEHGTEKTDAEAVRYKTFTWDTISVGKCEIRDGYQLTIYSDGRWKAYGKFKCNAGGIISCDIDVGHKLKSSSGTILVHFDAWEKSAGPGSERTVNESGSNSGISEHFNEIRRASAPTDCEWGP